MQKGQSELELSLEFPLTFQTWSSPLLHFHQIFLIVPATTSYGVRFPFFVGCHSDANLGFVLARQLDLTTFLLAHTGQFWF